MAIDVDCQLDRGMAQVKKAESPQASAPEQGRKNTLAEIVRVPERLPRPTNSIPSSIPD
jgi:hypothetical protein